MSQASRMPAESLEMGTLLAEHGQLLSENLEYMAALSRYARAVGLCSTLGLEALAERIVEGLCLETRAQGGLLWIATDDEKGALHLATVRGLVKAGDEHERILSEAPPAGLEAVREPGSGAFVGPAGPGARAGAGEALYVRLRHAGRLLGVARVSDRLDASAFDAHDLAGAEQFAELAALALSNALRFRAMERSSLRDPRTRAYTPAFFDGVVATELEKAHRFGRNFSLLEIELSGLPALRARLGEAAAGALVEAFADRLQQALRGTDLCAVDGEARYRLLLAETDALGAAALKRRIRGLVEGVVREVAPDGPAPLLRLAAATFPADGARVADLTHCLVRRLDDEGRSLACGLVGTCRSFAESRLRLLRESSPVPPQLPEQALRFLLDEVRQRPHQRGLTWIAPVASLREAALEGLARLRGCTLRGELVLLGDDDPKTLLGVPVTCLPLRRVGPRTPFFVHLGETQAYAFLRERDADDAPVFHSSDRALVEHLAFQLQRDLGRQIAA